MLSLSQKRILYSSSSQCFGSTSINLARTNRSFCTFIISRMLGGGSNLLIGDLIELQFLGNSYNLNLGSAMSLVLMVIVLLCMSFTSSFDESEMEGVM